MKVLKIGRIPYGNLFPIFYNLINFYSHPCYQFISGVPTYLNNLLKEGAIDLSPSSSIEYIKNKDLYNYIDGHSVSSFGQVGSIFLFSHKPIETLNEKIVKVTSHSATSVSLLKIITREFYKIKPVFIIEPRPYEDKQNPFLLIGDEALRQFKIDNEHPYIYDLGQLWYNFTGLPFVFALWIVRKKNIQGDKKDLYNGFIENLNKAKKKAVDNLGNIADCCDLKGILAKDEIMDYWNKIDYNLTDKHKKSLKLFEQLYFKSEGTF